MILNELLAAGDGFVSGTVLAERMGVSRVAVWTHMEKLRAEGFAFEARPRLGYRITRTPTEVSPLFLKTLLSPEWRELPIHFHDTIDSTNSEAERLLANGSETPLVVVARAQQRGRGRLGRQWHSADSGNLYLSFVFQPRLSPRRMQTFTLWMGTAICEFLNKGEQVPAQVKWPNDLLLDGKKIGGILTEARVDHDQIRDLVFGLGLNVNGNQESLPPELRSTATSIAASAGEKRCLNRFTGALLTCVMEAYREFTNGGHEEKFRSFWPRYDSLFGKIVSAHHGTARSTGIARGINDDGALLLEQADGSHTEIHAGDVTLEKAQA